MDAKTCRCPNRPYFGGMARDSTMERRALAEWNAEHGSHSYAKARDELARALQLAESSVRGEEQKKAGEAVMDMVHDIMGLYRRLPAPQREAAPVSDDVRERALRNGMPPSGRWA